MVHVDIPCNADSPDCPLNEICLQNTYPWTQGGNFTCGCDTWFGAERHPVTHECVELSFNAYYMLIDCAVQVGLSIIAVVQGILLRSMMLFLSRRRAQAETKWACVWSCILGGFFFGINRIVVVIQVLTPQAYDICCEPVWVDGTRKQYKYHALRAAAVVSLYAGVICSVLAIHAVAFLFVSQALGIRGIQNNSRIEYLKWYLHVSIWIYVAACLVLYFVNNGYIGAIGVFYSFSISMMFFCGARTILKELQPLIRGGLLEVHTRTVLRTRKLQRRIQITTYLIYASSLLLFIASVLYIGTTVAYGGWRGTSIPGQVSISAVGNNWISGSMLFYVFAIEWVICRILKDSLRKLPGGDHPRAPPIRSHSGSSSTSQDSSMAPSSECPNIELQQNPQPQHEPLPVNGSSLATSSSQSQSEGHRSHTASASTTQESTRKDISSNEVQMTLT